MTSDEKTLLPSLLSYQKSDLFTIQNISSTKTLSIDVTDTVAKKWDVVISYIPIEFSRIIESQSDIYTIEKFDKKYSMNPKYFCYEKYGLTNMWRLIMALNKCPTIMDFDFDFIKVFNIQKLQDIMSVLISRYNL